MLIRKQARKRKNQKQNVAALLAGSTGATTATVAPNSTTASFPHSNNPSGNSGYAGHSNQQLVNSNITNEPCKSKIWSTTSPTHQILFCTNCKVRLILFHVSFFVSKILLFFFCKKCVLSEIKKKCKW